MFLAYMDECGNTGTNPDPDQPIHFIGCLVVEDTKVREFEKGISEVARKYFPKTWRSPKFEFHGVELFAGTGCFKGDPQIRIDATAALIALAKTHCAAFGYVGVDKIKSFAKDHPHRICFSLLVEHLEAWRTRRDSLALLVSGENQEVESDIIKDIATFKDTSTQWGYKQVPIEHIVDSVHFVKSHHSPLIQIADILTYITLKAILIKRKRLPEFIKRPDKKQGFSDWAAENYSKSELATRTLWSSINFSHFCHKVWPT